MIDTLRALLDGRRWVCLTGAGVSTDSGIPDYRGPSSPPANPMTYDTFVGSEAARRRYWARSMQGWRSFTAAQPNGGHRALALLGVPVITQNVDGLHQAAGSEQVLDLHGRIDRVVCLGCRRVSGRADLQDRLERANPHLGGSLPAGAAELRPDGDAEVAEAAEVTVVACEACGGVLKPDVVFFGESVPRDRVALAADWVDAADAMVVAGSSLTVMSGLRFARQAARRGVPLAIINRGPTRGDGLADVRLHAGTSEVLTSLARPGADRHS